MRCPGSLLTAPNESLPKFSLYSYYSNKDEELRNTSHFLLYSETEEAYVDLLRIDCDSRVRLYCLCCEAAPEDSDSLLRRRPDLETVQEQYIVTNYITTWSFDYLTNTVWILSDADIWYQLNSKPFDEYRDIWEASERCTSIWFQLYRIIQNEATEEFSKVEEQLVEHRDDGDMVKMLLKRVGSQLTWDRLVSQLDEDQDAIREKERIIKQNAAAFKDWMYKQTILILAEDRRKEDVEFEFVFKRTAFCKTLKKYLKQQQQQEEEHENMPPSPPIEIEQQQPTTSPVSSDNQQSPPVSSTTIKKRRKKSTSQDTDAESTSSRTTIKKRRKKSITPSELDVQSTSSRTTIKKRRKKPITQDTDVETTSSRTIIKKRRKKPITQDTDVETVPSRTTIKKRRKKPTTQDTDTERTTSRTTIKKRRKKSSTQETDVDSTSSHTKITSKREQISPDLPPDSPPDSANRKRKLRAVNGLTATARRKRRKYIIDDESASDTIVYDEEPAKSPPPHVVSDAQSPIKLVVVNREIILDDDEEEEYLECMNQKPRNIFRSMDNCSSGIPASRFEDLGVFNQCSLCDKFAVEFVTCTRFNAEDGSCVFQCCPSCITGAQWKHWMKQDFLCPSCKLRI